MRRSAVRITIWVIGAILLFSILFGPGLLELPFTLLFGWIPSALRLLNVWHPTSGMILVFALALIVLVTGTHVFTRWLYLQWQREGVSPVPLRWRFKWTLCGFGILFCSLVTISSLVLTVHQIYWLSRSTDPLFSDPFREKLRTMITGMNLQNEAEKADWDPAKTREAFGRLKSGDPTPEAIQPVWIQQDEHKLRAIILVPRRPLHRAFARVTVIQKDAKPTSKKLEELPEVLASFGISNSSEKPPP